MLRDLFGKSKYVTVKRGDKSGKKEGDEKADNRLWTKCPECEEIIFNKKLAENLMVCPKCEYHLRITVRDRLQMTVDEDSFTELGSDLHTADVLDFPGYNDKFSQAQAKTGLDEAIIIGEASIDNYEIVIGVMDFHFMGGSMGSVVGERVTLAVERAVATGKPLIIFSTAGGARMQEGMLSLMQMAKTSAAVKKLHKAGNLFISVMTDPTSGGVTASFASLGDIIIAETGALIAFAGPRVIKQTISTSLPEEFQRAEFLLEHGMIDKVVRRQDLNDELTKILKIHQAGVS